jgi:hypothetical protein
MTLNVADLIEPETSLRHHVSHLPGSPIEAAPLPPPFTFASRARTFLPVRFFDD